MAFGNLITDGTQVAVGTYGYVASFDYSAERIKQVIGAQLQDVAAEELSGVEASAASRDALMAYAEDANCPDFAWYAAGSTVFVFCKTSVYPYSSNTRLAIYFYSNPEPVTATSDTLIPDRLPAEAKELFKSLCLRQTLTLLGKRIPVELSNKVGYEKERLGLDS